MARKAKRKHASIKDLGNIDRFAGSSEEEGSSSDEDSVEEEEEVAMAMADDKPKSAADVEDDDEYDPVVIQTGMASAMNRILSSRSTSSGAAVLSKVKTKLQVQVAKEEKEQKDLRDRKKLNREKKLVAMHIPLTGDAIVEEMELERSHKRIATKGIVALFNAISQHQQPKDNATTKNEETKGPKSKEKKLTKDGFLDMIKKQASASSGGEPIAPPAKEIESKQHKKPTKWGALQDDFMFDGKKNWDEESSEDEQLVADE